MLASESAVKSTLAGGTYGRSATSIRNLNVNSGTGRGRRWREESGVYVSRDGPLSSFHVIVRLSVDMRLITSPPVRYRFKGAFRTTFRWFRCLMARANVYYAERSDNMQNLNGVPWIAPPNYGTQSHAPI